MSMLATRIALRIGGSSMVHGTGGSHMELGCSARLGQDTAFQLSRGTEEQCWNAFAKAAFSPARLGSQGLNTLVTTKTFG